MATRSGSSRTRARNRLPTLLLEARATGSDRPLDIALDATRFSVQSDVGGPGRKNVSSSSSSSDGMFAHDRAEAAAAPRGATETAATLDESFLERDGEPRLYLC